MANLADIAPGHIISCIVDLDGRQTSKLFLVLAHLEDSALCLKITSNVGFYRNNPTRAAGAVFCRGEHPALSLQSVIETDNDFLLPHRRLGAPFLANDRAAISSDLLGRLKAAVASSLTLSPVQKQELQCHLEAIAL